MRGIYKIKMCLKSVSFSVLFKRQSNSNWMNFFQEKIEEMKPLFFFSFSSFNLSWRFSGPHTQESWEESLRQRFENCKTKPLLSVNLYFVNDNLLFFVFIPATIKETGKVELWWKFMGEEKKLWLVWETSFLAKSLLVTPNCMLYWKSNQRSLSRSLGAELVITVSELQ